MILTKSQKKSHASDPRSKAMNLQLEFVFNQRSNVFRAFICIVYF